jgi:hypothetical protein
VNNREALIWAGELLLLAIPYAATLRLARTGSGAIAS